MKVFVFVAFVCALLVAFATPGAVADVSAPLARLQPAIQEALVKQVALLEMTASATPAPAAASTTAAPANTPAPAPSPGQTVVIERRSQSGGDLFLQYLPFIIFFLVLAIIIFLIYIFREKIPTWVGYIETCCGWTGRIIAWPFRMIWRGFKWCFYPIKECCLDMCGACTECCYPSHVKL